AAWRGSDGEVQCQRAQGGETAGGKVMRDLQEENFKQTVLEGAMLSAENSWAAEF
ncbi:hypothetical protein AAFF_G00236320, partial [Aldrovandia affinis]